MTTPAILATTVKVARRTLKLKQADLAGAAGVGIRFVFDLEAGKPMVQLGKALAVLDALGFDCRVVPRSEGDANMR